MKLPRKRALLLLTAILLLAGAGMAWRHFTTAPSIHFVKFEDGPNGRVAVFKIVNDTSVPWSYVGYGGQPGDDSPWPDFEIKLLDVPKKKEDELAFRCGIGLSLHTLAAGAVQEFRMEPDESAPKSRFAVGVSFLRGSAADVQADYMLLQTSRLRQWLEHGKKLLHLPREPAPTWSHPVLAAQP